EAPDLRPGGVEAREVEVALRGEMAVEHRLGDTALPRDLSRRGRAVARPAEDANGRVQDAAPPLGGGHARTRDAHAASARGCSCSAWRYWRTRMAAAAAPARQISALTRIANVRPWTNACGGSA